MRGKLEYLSGEKPSEQNETTAAPIIQEPQVENEMKLRSVLTFNFFVKQKQMSLSFRVQNSVSVLSIDNATQRERMKNIVYSDWINYCLRYESQWLTAVSLGVSCVPWMFMKYIVVLGVLGQY